MQSIIFPQHNDCTSVSSLL